MIAAIINSINRILGRKKTMYTYTFMPVNGTPVTFTTDAVLPSVAGVISQVSTDPQGGPPPTDPV